MDKNISVLSIVIAIIILLRCVFNNSENLLYIVAGINIVAIVFVVYTIIEKVTNNIIDKIKKSSVPKEIIKREVEHARIKIWGWSLAINIIVIILYIFFWRSNLGNDIISILALGISILDNEIEKKITENYKI